MTPISIVIISHNEAKRIEACLKAAAKITNDIIVIDNDSTDGTPNIAKKYTSKVFSVEWIGYGANRNIGASKAENDWILSLDCDEVCTPEFIESIKSISLKRNNIYRINRKTNFWGQWMRFSGLRNDWIRRLYHKEDHKWNDNNVHERLTGEKEKASKNLSGRVLHYSFESPDDLRTKYDNYSRLSAQNIFRKDQKPTWLKKIFAPGFRFIKTYLLQLGFLDGHRGWFYACQASKMVRNRYRFLKELSNKGNNI